MKNICFVILKLLIFLLTSCSLRTAGTPDDLRNKAYTDFGKFYSEECFYLMTGHSVSAVLKVIRNDTLENLLWSKWT